MRTLLLSLAGMAAACVCAHADGFDDSAPMFKGYLEGFGGYAWSGLTEQETGQVAARENSAGGVFGGAARAAFGIAEGWGGQADLWAQRDNFGGRYCVVLAPCSSDPHYLQTWGVGVHVNHHTPGVPLLGALLSFGSNANTSYGETRFVNVAGEAQYQIGPLTLYGQAGYVDRVAGGTLNGSNPHAWYVHGELQYFKNQETLIAGNIGYGHYDVGTFPGLLLTATGEHANILRWGARAEYKFSLKSPLSVFVSYEGAKVDARYTYTASHYDDTVLDTTVLVGAHWWLQDGSLQLNERTTAGLVDWNPVFGKDVVLY